MFSTVSAQKHESIILKAMCLFFIYLLFLKKWVCCCVLDVQQSMIGSCTLEDVAVKVLTRVVGHCPHRNQLLVDCGWSGLRYLHQTFDLCFQNRPVLFKPPCALSLDGAGALPTGYAVIEGHPDLKYCSLLFSKLKLWVMKFQWKLFPPRLGSMTQEHGRVEPISGPLDYSKYPLGTMLTLIPYHVSILAFWGVRLGLFDLLTDCLTFVCCLAVLCHCSDAFCVPRVLWWSSGGEVAPNTRVVNSSNLFFCFFFFLN